MRSVSLRCTPVPVSLLSFHVVEGIVDGLKAVVVLFARPDAAIKAGTVLLVWTLEWYGCVKKGVGSVFPYLSRVWRIAGARMS